MKRVVYLGPADDELAQAAERYDTERKGLGRAFLGAIQATERRIQRDPLVWPFRRKPTRSCRVQGFPYRLHYVDEPDRIVVVAVAHSSRQPDYWTDRL